MSEEQIAVEEKARSMGWVPLDEFRGDEDRWSDAKTFLEKGENTLPILRERYDKLFATTQELKKKNAETETLVKALAEQYKGAEKVAYERAVKDVRAEMKAAAAAGDVEQYEAAEAKLDETLKKAEEVGKLPEVKKEVDAPGEGDTLSPAFRSWHAKNQWYEGLDDKVPPSEKSDSEMSRYAESQFHFLKAVKPDIGEAELYTKVTEEVKRRFPDKFPGPVKEGDAVDGGGEAPGGKKHKGKKNFDNLPEKQKVLFKDFVARGYLVNDDKNKERYANEYYAINP